MTRDPGEIFITSNTKDPCNLVNNNTCNTNSMDLDTGLRPIMAKELQQLRQLISSVFGAVQPIPEVSPISHKISRFTPAIADTEIPKCVQIPNMKPYDGTTDPEEHVP